MKIKDKTFFILLSVGCIAMALAGVSMVIFDNYKIAMDLMGVAVIDMPIIIACAAYLMFTDKPE